MQYVDNLGNIAENYYELLSLFPAFSVVMLAMSAEQLLNPGWYLVSVTPEERLNLLKALTGFTVALRPDFNCYPRGIAETTCFDADGNEIP